MTDARGEGRRSSIMIWRVERRGEISRLRTARAGTRRSSSSPLTLMKHIVFCVEEQQGQGQRKERTNVQQKG